MPPARASIPTVIKMHRSYSVGELAAVCGVHKNTVRHWQRQGLEPIDDGRPVLFQGAAVRDFLAERNASRKRPCPPGTLYCFRCREPRPPALGMVDYRPDHGSGQRQPARAVRELRERSCTARVRETEIAQAMPGCTVQFSGRPATPKRAQRASP